MKRHLLDSKARGASTPLITRLELPVAGGRCLRSSSQSARLVNRPIGTSKSAFLVRIYNRRSIADCSASSDRARRLPSTPTDVSTFQLETACQTNPNNLLSIITFISIRNANTSDNHCAKNHCTSNTVTRKHLYVKTTAALFVLGHIGYRKLKEECVLQLTKRALADPIVLMRIFNQTEKKTNPNTTRDIL